MAIAECYQNHKACNLLSYHLRYIADRTVRDWRRILSELGVNDCVIETVVEDARSLNYLQDSREIAYQGYLKWQQINPKKASFCVLAKALNTVQRNDIKEELQQEFGIGRKHNKLTKSYSSPSSVNYFVGRDDETQRILEFSGPCCDSKLMLLIGLPGTGKRELLNNSLCKVSGDNADLHIIRPLLPSNDQETKWGLEDIAVCILEELHPGICVSKHRVAVLHKMLNNIKESTLLVLEIANLNFKPEAIMAFWTFIDRLVRFENSYLKVIVTSYKNPDLNQMQHLTVEEVVLKELDVNDSCKLLKHMNPDLDEKHCRKIYQFCGGNPFILRKLGAHIRNFTSAEKVELKNLYSALEMNNEVELKPFIRQTVLKRDMRIVFNDLDKDEQDALVKLCCFYEIIPVDMATILFGSKIIDIANHLCDNHCILDRELCGSYYRMNGLTRNFIIDYALSNESWSSVLLDAKIKLICFHLKLLRQLDESFYGQEISPHFDLCNIYIRKYQNECKNCKHICECTLSQKLQVIFQRDKTSIMQSIKRGLDHEEVFSDTATNCLRAINFLRHVVTPVELQQLYDLIFEKLKLKGDKIQMAVTMANLVFIKISHHIHDEKDQNILSLSKSIEFLERNQAKLTSENVETLAWCYVNRGYLRGFYKQQFRKGKFDIEKARAIFKTFHKSSRQTVAELSTHGYMAAIYYRNQMLQESVKERSIQIQGYQCYLGTHPFTAKSLHYQAQGYSKLKMYEKAISCCIVSYQMYYNLKGEGVETMRVLSTHGKVLIRQKKIVSGIKKLEQALLDGEKVLGEHDKIAKCYDQLADAKANLKEKEDEVEKLRNKACDMRHNFDRKTSLVNRKTYSLQLSHDEMSKFQYIYTEEPDNVFQFAALMMLIVMLWNIFTTICQPRCKNN